MENSIHKNYPTYNMHIIIYPSTLPPKHANFEVHMGFGLLMLVGSHLLKNKKKIQIIMMFIAIL